MTWEEFKKVVESKGVSDQTELQYIDTSFGYDIEVEFKDGKVAIF